MAYETKQVERAARSLQTADSRRQKRPKKVGIEARTCMGE